MTSTSRIPAIRIPGKLPLKCFTNFFCAYKVVPGERGKGYAMAVVQMLCNEIHKQNRIPCVFAPEEQEYTIFRRMGFEKYGKWGTIQMKGDNR